MKSKKRLVIAASTLSIALIVLTGCVTRTTVKNEARAEVHFTDPQAAQTFYDAYLATSHPTQQSNSVCIYIQLPLPYRHHRVSTENVAFNRAVRSADSDTNGVISDIEASAYATKIKQPRAQAKEIKNGKS